MRAFSIFLDIFNKKLFYFLGYYFKCFVFAGSPLLFSVYLQAVGLCCVFDIKQGLVYRLSLSVFSHFFGVDFFGGSCKLPVCYWVSIK